MIKRICQARELLKSSPPTLHRVATTTSPSSPGRVKGGRRRIAAATRRRPSLHIRRPFRRGRSNMMLIILVSDARVQLMPIGTEFDPPDVFLGISRGAPEVRR